MKADKKQESKLIQLLLERVLGSLTSIKKYNISGILGQW